MFVWCSATPTGITYKQYDTFNRVASLITAQLDVTQGTEKILAFDKETKLKHIRHLFISSHISSHISSQPKNTSFYFFFFFVFFVLSCFVLFFNHLTLARCTAFAAVYGSVIGSKKKSHYFFLAKKKNEGVKISALPPSHKSMAVAFNNADTCVEPDGAIPMVSKVKTMA